MQSHGGVTSRQPTTLDHGSPASQDACGVTPGHGLRENLTDLQTVNLAVLRGVSEG